jgi:hypothetical protein
LKELKSFKQKKAMEKWNLEWSIKVRRMKLCQLRMHKDIEVW